MGCFNTIIVTCPNCSEDIELQSKAGTCQLHVYGVDTAPILDLADIASGAPVTCEYCGGLVRVVVHMTATIHGSRKEEVAAEQDRLEKGGS